MPNGKWTKKELLSRPVEHIDITKIDTRAIIESYRDMAYSARTLAQAADIYSMMLRDRECAVILTLAGSLISAGLKKAVITLVECNMVDAIVSTGANIVDQDFFEGLGFKHYIAPGSPEAPPVDDMTLRNLMIDRIYDTYIDEDNLRDCDDATYKVFNAFEPGAYSSREFLDAMGAYLVRHHPRNESIVKSCFQKRIPIFVPAFSDCSAGFGIVLQQTEAIEQGRGQVAFDSGKDFRELTDIKLACKDTGLLMLGGGVPKNFAQDIVVAAELLSERKGGKARGDVGMHKYAVQMTVADSRDGALSGSTLREACSWGKVDIVHEQMVFGELSALFPILASDAYHRAEWKKRKGFKFADLFEKGGGAPEDRAPEEAGRGPRISGTGILPVSAMLMGYEHPARVCTQSHPNHCAHPKSSRQSRPHAMMHHPNTPSQAILARHAMLRKAFLCIVGGALTTLAVAWSLALLGGAGHQGERTEYYPVPRPVGWPSHLMIYRKVTKPSIGYLVADERTPLPGGPFPPMNFASLESHWRANRPTEIHFRGFNGGLTPAYDVRAWGWPAPALSWEFISIDHSLSQPQGPSRGGIHIASERAMARWMPPRGLFMADRMIVLPLLPVWRGILIDTALYSAVIASIWLGIPTARTYRRRRRNLCIRCAYSRAGLPPGVPCPECGHDAPALRAPAS